MKTFENFSGQTTGNGLEENNDDKMIQCTLLVSTTIHLFYHFCSHNASLNPSHLTDQILWSECLFVNLNSRNKPAKWIQFMFDFKCTKAMLLLIRGKGKCRTFFMIKKTHCASDTSIILCNVYIVSQHFIPDCIATTFSFTQTFLVCPVGGEKPQENSFYFLSSWSNLTKSGGNFSSWFCKNIGAAPV